jgi:acetyltransferase-like isoleucine patch superfamily enzyme
MDTVIVNDIESIYSECRSHKVSIYGAKTIALRACNFLLSRGENVECFVTSSRYKNPDMLYGKPVKRIEEDDESYDCMLLAISGKWSDILSVEKELSRYDIQKLVMINPNIVEDFPSCRLLSITSRISNKSSISKIIQIVIDDTSSLTIEDNVVIRDGSLIKATDNSHIHIGEGCCIDEECAIIADSGSEIKLEQFVNVREKTGIRVMESSLIHINSNVLFGRMCDIECRHDSKIYIGGKSLIFDYCHICSVYDSQILFEGNDLIRKFTDIVNNENAKIIIGRDSTFGDNLNLGATCAEINIGADNMFSYYVNVFTGAHGIIDEKTNENILNRNPIRTGNHVWVGVGATLLSGCDVGNNSIIGGAAVVTKHLEPHCSYAGNPVRMIKKDIDWIRG